MKVEQVKLLDFLGQPGERFVVPVFQRVYSWTAWQCEELLGDCLRAAEAGAEHFMGLLLYSEDAQEPNVLDIIDGQQRLTTVSLLIAALGQRGLQARYLQAFARNSATPQCKLALSGQDRDTLAALAGAGDMPEEPASRLVENYLFFKGKLDSGEASANAVLRGLQALEVAAVQLEPIDSPQLVFESLNSKGMPLSTADRVRSLMVVTDDGQGGRSLLEGFWLPFEQMVARAKPPASATDVLHAWLAQHYRARRVFDKSEVFNLFKQRLRDDFGGSWEDLFTALDAYARTYLKDAELRETADESARKWVEGKPDELISEYKMFGD